MLNVMVFGSGGGSNFKAIYNTIQQENLRVTISCVVSNNSSAGILNFAKEHGIDTFHLSKKHYKSDEAYEKAYHDLLDTYACDFVFLAGYMKLIPASFINRLPRKILNIHPSLLPSFGGEGMYGMNVHKAVFNSGVKISGATVHFVTEHYDEGPIIKQKSVELSGSESVEDISKKVLNVEHLLYSDVLKVILNNAYKIENNKVVLLEQESE